MGFCNISVHSCVTVPNNVDGSSQIILKVTPITIELHGPKCGTWFENFVDGLGSGQARGDIDAVAHQRVDIDVVFPRSPHLHNPLRMIARQESIALRIDN